MKPKYKSAQTVTVSSDKQNARAERHKYLFELMKHMTTLSSGSILLLITFLEKVLNEKIPHRLITLSSCGFCFSIIFSIGTMLMMAAYFGEKFPDEDKNYFIAVAVLAIMGFFVGMFSLTIAAYRFY